MSVATFFPEPRITALSQWILSGSRLMAEAHSFRERPADAGLFSSLRRVFGAHRRLRAGTNGERATLQPERLVESPTGHTISGTEY